LPGFAKVCGCDGISVGERESGVRVDCRYFCYRRSLVSVFPRILSRSRCSCLISQDERPAYTMTGFARNAVMKVADKVIDGVKSGQIKNFFLIGYVLVHFVYVYYYYCCCLAFFPLKFA
jgi:hypothetical protein